MSRKSRSYICGSCSGATIWNSGMAPQTRRTALITLRRSVSMPARTGRPPAWRWSPSAGRPDASGPRWDVRPVYSGAWQTGTLTRVHEGRVAPDAPQTFQPLDQHLVQGVLGEQVHRDAQEESELGWQLGPTGLGHASFGHGGFRHRLRYRHPQGIQGGLAREFGLFLNLAYHESHEMASCDRWYRVLECGETQ
jgi:hypothetical protein